jgi:uncharacterized membrane protein
MIRVEHGQIIRRPLAEVFAFFADFEALPSWQPEFTEVRKLGESAVGSGTNFSYTRKLPFGKQRGTMEFTEYEPNRRFAFRALPGPILPRGRMQFEAVAGGTRVQELFEAEIRGPLKLLTPLLRRQLAKDVRKDMQEARRRLEARAAGSG